MTSWASKIESAIRLDYHPELRTTLKSLDALPVNKFPHIILFGCDGSRKHTLALRIIHGRSGSKLTYKRRLLVQGKVDSYIDVSDTHAEVDFETFASIKKPEWTEAYCAIVRAARVSKSDNFFMVCLNIQWASHDLLKNMYAYMQGLEGPSITFIITTNNYTSLPQNLTARCLRINVRRPSKSLLSRTNDCLVARGQTLKREIQGLVGTSGEQTIAELRGGIYNLLERRFTCSEIILELVKVVASKQEVTTDQAFLVMKTLKRLETTRRQIYHLEHLVLKITDRNGHIDRPRSPLPDTMSKEPESAETRL